MRGGAGAGLKFRPAQISRLPTGFHEILVEDMGVREWPKVTLSEIGCLRLDWPQEFFTFVGRYQLELEQMRKECRDRFEGISSGACPTCEKFIQNNLGRHVAMFHLDLALPGRLVPSLEGYVSGLY